MSDLALNDLVLTIPRSEPLSRADQPRMRSMRLLALVLALAGIALPDCCMNGSHAFGSGMATFGSICRAGL
jgi:hypothetical protein